MIHIPLPQHFFFTRENLVTKKKVKINSHIKKRKYPTMNKTIIETQKLKPKMKTEEIG